MKHAFVVPLIGGQAIAQAQVFKSLPIFLQSYSDFAVNDAHLRAWWPDVPFDVLDTDVIVRHAGILDVVGSTCPCAGLSSLSSVSSATSKVNDWMLLVAEHVLRELKPRVYWGENAPALSSQKGWPVARRLCALGRKLNYSFSIYRTKSALHRLPQTRQRTFYFFWRDRAPNEVPILPWINEPMSIENWFSTKRDGDASSAIFLKSEKPSELAMYRFLLERDGIDHATFVSRLKKTMTVPSYLNKLRVFDELLIWLEEQGLEKDVKRTFMWYEHYIMQSMPWDRYLILPRKIIGAYIGYYLWGLAHPFEDRFLNLREMLDMMGLPLNFTVPKKDAWHITQNVPTQTARDAANFILLYLNDKLEMTHYKNKDTWLVFDNIRRDVYAWPVGDGE